MRAALTLLVLAAAGVAAYVAWGAPHRPGSLAWRAVDRDLAARFPDVPTTTTAALAARVERGEVPVLLDARAPAEFAVSHLPGARRVDPDADARALAAALADVDRQRPVVVYCSVGVRSARVTQRLQEAGFTSVANLEGSVFAWANEGRPLVTAGGPAETVHPYDAVWGRLLAPDRRAEGE